MKKSVSKKEQDLTWRIFKLWNSYNFLCHGRPGMHEEAKAMIKKKIKLLKQQP